MWSIFVIGRLGEELTVILPTLSPIPQSLFPLERSHDASAYNSLQICSRLRTKPVKKTPKETANNLQPPRPCQHFIQKEVQTDSE